MTFPASFSPLAGKAPAAFGAPEPSDSFALPGSKAAEAAGASSVMATVGPPLVAQAAAGQLVGQRVLNALIDLGLEKLVILVGPGVGYITGGLSALLGELAFPQSTANADHLAALMSALAAEGVTFNGRVAWETLPDGRRMMVSADDPNLIIAIVREDGTLFINPIFLPGGGRAGSGDGVTPETLMASPVGSAVPSHTGDVSIYVPDYSVIERRMRAAGREHTTPLSVIADLRESVATFNQGARPGDMIELMLPVKTAAGETVFLLLEGRTGAMRAEIEELRRAGFFPDDTRSIEDIISAAALLSGLTGELRAIVAGGRNVIPGPLEETREGLLGPDTPSRPDWRRMAGQEGFPRNMLGVPPYTDTGNRNPPAPPAATEPGPQIPPDPREFDPSTTFPPLETQPAAPAGQISEVDEVEGARTVESIAEFQEALREFGMVLTDVLSDPALPASWREVVFPRSEAEAIEMANAVLPVLRDIHRQFPNALNNLKIDVNGPNPADLSEGRQLVLGLTASDIGLMFLETPTRIHQIIAGSGVEHPDMPEHAYYHEIGHALTAVAVSAMQYLRSGYATLLEISTEFSTHASEDAVSLDVALGSLYPHLSMEEAYAQLARDYHVRPHPTEILTWSLLPDTWREHVGTLQVMERPIVAPRESASEYATQYATVNDKEFLAEILAFFLRGEPVEARADGANAPFISTTLGAPLPDFLRERARDVLVEAQHHSGPTSTWAPEWRESGTGQ